MLLSAGSCCIPLTNIVFCSGMQLSFLWINLILLRLTFKHYQGKSRVVSSLGFIQSHFFMRIVSNVLYIMRSFHSGWWEHKVFPTLCELQEMFSYCLPVVISFTSNSFLSHAQINTQKKTERIPCRFPKHSLSWYLRLLHYSSSQICLPDVPKLQSILLTLARLLGSLWVSLLVLWPGNCLQAVTWDQLLSLKGYIYLLIFHFISVSQLQVHLICFPKSCEICYPISGKSCFVYFVWFSRCLQQEGNSNSS